MTDTTIDTVAIVTGGASGIGLAIAERLAHDGAAVAVLDLNGADAEAAAAKIRAAGGNALAVQVDVSDRAAVEGAVEQVRAELGPVTILVNNAGKEGFQPFLSISLESWNSILAVNLTGTFHCVQAAVPDMLEAGWGRIVTISSSSAQSGAARMAHYVASKGGVVGFTKALALELAPHGITVNTIPPGFIDTPMARRSADAGHLPRMDVLAARTPVGRVGTPDDVAAMCAFLCSDDAGYITGQVIGVNGGRNTA